MSRIGLLCICCSPTLVYGITLLQIIGVDGQPVGLKAINYFGFNNGATMFDGLYAGSNSLTQDFGLNLYRIQVEASLGTSAFEPTSSDER